MSKDRHLWPSKAWIGIVILGTLGKCSPVIKEKCLPLNTLVDHACSASNPSAAFLNEGSGTGQLPCYCKEEACNNYAVQKVELNCRTGYVHSNKCGACVRCAKDLGEACGGLSDYQGVCRQGLICEIKASAGSEGEGKCITEASKSMAGTSVYKSPKATFDIRTLKDFCLKGNSSTPAGAEAGAEKGDEGKKKGGNALRSLSSVNQVNKDDKSELAELEKAWKEVFSENFDQPKKVSRNRLIQSATRSPQPGFMQQGQIQGSSLEVGKMVKSFDTLKEAEEYLESKGLKFDQVNGVLRAKIKDLKKALAVPNPKELLKEMESVPPIEDGEVVAGKLKEFPLIKRVSRSAPDYSNWSQKVVAISPKHQLKIGELVGSYKTGQENNLKVEGHDVTSINGKVVQGKVMEAHIVKNPLKVLRSLNGKVRKVNGQVVAGHDKTNVVVLDDHNGKKGELHRESKSIKTKEGEVHAFGSAPRRHYRVSSRNSPMKMYEKLLKKLDEVDNLPKAMAVRAGQENDYGYSGNDYATTGNDYAAPGNDYVAPGNDYAAPGNDYAAPGNDYAGPGNDYAAPGNDYVVSGNDYQPDINQPPNLGGDDEDCEDEDQMNPKSMMGQPVTMKTTKVVTSTSTTMDDCDEETEQRVGIPFGQQQQQQQQTATTIDVIESTSMIDTTTKFDQLSSEDINNIVPRLPDDTFAAGMMTTKDEMPLRKTTKPFQPIPRPTMPIFPGAMEQASGRYGGSTNFQSSSSGGIYPPFVADNFITPGDMTQNPIPKHHDQKGQPKLPKKSGPIITSPLPKINFNPKKNFPMSKHLQPKANSRSFGADENSGYGMHLPYYYGKTSNSIFPDTVPKSLPLPEVDFEQNNNFEFSNAHQSHKYGGSFWGGGNGAFESYDSTSNPGMLFTTTNPMMEPPQINNFPFSKKLQSKGSAGLLLAGGAYDNHIHGKPPIKSPIVTSRLPKIDFKSSHQKKNPKSWQPKFTAVPGNGPNKGLAPHDNIPKSKLGKKMNEIHTSPLPKIDFKANNNKFKFPPKQSGGSLWSGGNKGQHNGGIKIKPGKKMNEIHTSPLPKIDFKANNNNNKFQNSNGLQSKKFGGSLWAGGSGAHDGGLIIKPGKKMNEIHTSPLPKIDFKANNKNNFQSKKSGGSPWESLTILPHDSTPKPKLQNKFPKINFKSNQMKKSYKTWQPKTNWGGNNGPHATLIPKPSNKFTPRVVQWTTTQTSWSEPPWQNFMNNNNNIHNHKNSKYNNNKSPKKFPIFSPTPFGEPTIFDSDWQHESNFNFGGESSLYNMKNQGTKRTRLPIYTPPEHTTSLGPPPTWQGSFNGNFDDEFNHNSWELNSKQSKHGRGFLWTTDQTSWSEPPPPSTWHVPFNMHFGGNEFSKNMKNNGIMPGIPKKSPPNFNPPGFQWTTTQTSWSEPPWQSNFHYHSSNEFSKNMKNWHLRPKGSNRNPKLTPPPQGEEWATDITNYPELPMLTVKRFPLTTGSPPIDPIGSSNFGGNEGFGKKRFGVTFTTTPYIPTPDSIPSSTTTLTTTESCEDTRDDVKMIPKKGPRPGQPFMPKENQGGRETPPKKEPKNKPKTPRPPPIKSDPFLPFLGPGMPDAKNPKTKRPGQPKKPPVNPKQGGNIMPPKTPKNVKPSKPPFRPLPGPNPPPISKKPKNPHLPQPPMPLPFPIGGGKKGGNEQTGMLGQPSSKAPKISTKIPSGGILDSEECDEENEAGEFLGGQNQEERLTPPKKNGPKTSKPGKPVNPVPGNGSPGDSMTKVPPIIPQEPNLPFPNSDDETGKPNPIDGMNANEPRFQGSKKTLIPPPFPLTNIPFPEPNLSTKTNGMIPATIGPPPIPGNQPNPQEPNVQISDGQKSEECIDEESENPDQIGKMQSQMGSTPPKPGKPSMSPQVTSKRPKGDLKTQNVAPRTTKQTGPQGPKMAPIGIGQESEECEEEEDGKGPVNPGPIPNMNNQKSSPPPPKPGNPFMTSPKGPKMTTKKSKVDLKNQNVAPRGPKMPPIGIGQESEECEEEEDGKGPGGNPKINPEGNGKDKQRPNPTVNPPTRKSTLKQNPGGGKEEECIDDEMPESARLVEDQQQQLPNGLVLSFPLSDEALRKNDEVSPRDNFNGQTLFEDLLGSIHNEKGPKEGGKLLWLKNVKSSGQKEKGRKENGKSLMENVLSMMENDSGSIKSKQQQQVSTSTRTKQALVKRELVSQPNEQNDKRSKVHKLINFLMHSNYLDYF